MKYKKICKCCGEEFETNSPQKIYCDRLHYLPCPICGKPVLKTDKDFTRPPKCCSSKCTHELRKQHLPKRKCIICGEEFTPNSGINLVCSKEHYKPCEICGTPILIDIDHPKNTCDSAECKREHLRRLSQEKYGTDHPMQNAQVKENFKAAMKQKYGVEHALQYPKFSEKQQITAYKTNMEHNGVPYACLLEQCVEAQGKIISKLNKSFGDMLYEHQIQYSFERRIENHSYDICIEYARILIEIDPTYTHSPVKNHWGIARESTYHKTKSDIAISNGYRCIHVFDWDDWSKILNMLIPTKPIYARNCKLYKLNLEPTNEFLSKYHIQGTCKGQLLNVGLLYNDELVEVMTFGKPRYSTKHKIELLRLCTKPGYQVIGGASKLFNWAVSTYELQNIISYCDLSKFSGDVYEKLGMKHIRDSAPQEIWSKGTKRITANLLRQRGYDQLFHTNYGKGTSNEDLMLENGWLPIYDCGQAVYEF